MAYFERFKVNKADGTTVNPAEEEGIVLLRRIFQALKPLGQIRGAGNNRLLIDVQDVTTVSTVSTVSNITNFVPGAGAIGPVTGGGFELMKTLSRQSYNSGVRSKVT
jgi:hypothetical protein